MRGVAVLTSAFAVAGCGSDSTERATTTSGQGLSARFFQRTVYSGPDAGSLNETLRGAFDWHAMRGWAVRRSRVLQTRVVQIGARCYRRFDNEKWKRSRADDVDGLCEPDALRNPATADDLVRSIANGWESLGPAVVRGVATTHFRGRLNIGAVKGPIDMWIDKSGVVRRERESDGKGGFVSVRTYFDFGVEVHARAPKLGTNG